MTEIDKLISFMNAGKRTKISLTEYIVLQENKGEWNKKRMVQLRREVSLTDRLQITYRQSKTIETILQIK
ncbi:hypothetical protein ACFDAA_19640 [Enterococcus casseliflavus]|jgi:hypothetical protein|uniref:hypothetical protein n=1 Tax=Enterococcus TaxID=1350 RepID=UPI002DBBA6E7|nr:hypothetical protein [Enterococcus innesii]MEB5953049.1 hypothetical protein [Enterococcus innesii]